MTTPTLTVVLPCLNEGAHIADSLQTIAGVLDEAGIDHELLVVDDGSTDETWRRVGELAAERSSVRGIRLSRRFGKEHALCAGLEASRGRAVLVMDADLQHPPSLIPEMVAAWREGYEVVEGVKTDRGGEPAISGLQARAFYALLRRVSGIDLAGASDFKLMDRKVLEAWSRMPERGLFFRGMSAWLGFRRKELPFAVEARAGGSTAWSTRGLIRLGVTGITAFSSLPLQGITLMGILFLVFGALLGAQTLYNWISGEAVTGFTTVILLQLAVGSMLMIGLGVIGTYLSRIYDEVKGRPRYVVAERVGTEN